MSFQSNDELIRVFDEFARKFAPEGLILNGKNSKLLADYVFRRDGVASIAGLISAMKEISAQLDWVPLKSAHQVAIEQANKGDAKMRQDYYDSLKERDTQKTVVKKADDVRELAAAKELTCIKGEIDREINSYVCGHPSCYTDFSKTERGQETMRKVLQNYNRTTVENAQRALDAVRIAKSKLP